MMITAAVCIAGNYLIKSIDKMVAFAFAFTTFFAIIVSVRVVRFVFFAIISGTGRFVVSRHIVRAHTPVGDNRNHSVAATAAV